MAAADDIAGQVCIVEDAGVHRLRLRRSGRGNTIDTAMLVGLIEVLQQPDLPAGPLLIEGSPGVFSSGADISELSRFDDYAATVYSHLGHQVVAAIERWPGVTAAAVDGLCLGAGLELALGCDLILASPRARFSLPGLALALMPCLGGLRRLACRTGDDRCARLFLHGAVVDAEEALRIGLADQVLEGSDAMVEHVRRQGEWPTSAVLGIRDLRLRRQGAIDPTADAELFAATFTDGECQRRLRKLIAG